MFESILEDFNRHHSGESSLEEIANDAPNEGDLHLEENYRAPMVDVDLRNDARVNNDNKHHKKQTENTKECLGVDAADDNQNVPSNSRQKATVRPPPIPADLRQSIVLSKKALQEKHAANEKVLVKVKWEHEFGPLVLELDSSQREKRRHHGSAIPPPIPPHLKAQNRRRIAGKEEQRENMQPKIKLPSAPIHARQINRATTVERPLPLSYLLRGCIVCVLLGRGQRAQMQSASDEVCRVVYIDEGVNGKLCSEEHTHADIVFREYRNESVEHCELCIVSRGEVLALDSKSQGANNISVKTSHLMAIAGTCTVRQQSNYNAMGQFMELTIGETGIAFVQSGLPGSPLVTKVIQREDNCMQINARQLVAFTSNLVIEQREEDDMATVMSGQGLLVFSAIMTTFKN